MKSPSSYDFGSAYRTSLQVNWQIDDLIGGDHTLDFSKHFLPDVWVGADALAFLSPTEQLALNHIRAHSYLHIFGFVEEFIVPFVIDEARARVHHAEQEEIRALLHFAEEESKHIDLFKRFREDFRAGFTHECDVIGHADAVATQVLQQSPLGVILTILHIEWATQRHYVESVRENLDLDPQFGSLLKHHWLEEAQHTKLDLLLIEALAKHLNAQDIHQGIEDCLVINGMLNDGFVQQVELDLHSLARATGRTFSAQDTTAYRTLQLQSYQHTFLVAGMTYPNFMRTIETLSPDGPATIQAWASSLK